MVMMKPRTDVIVNSVIYLFWSPIIGLVCSGMITGALYYILAYTWALFGLIVTAVFSIEGEFRFILTFEDFMIFARWPCFVLGPAGGLYYGISTVKEKWLRYKTKNTPWSGT